MRLRLAHRPAAQSLLFSWHRGLAAAAADGPGRVAASFYRFGEAPLPAGQPRRELQEAVEAHCLAVRSRLHLC